MLSVGDGKVPDGVRYHVLDVWNDGLVETEGWEDTEVMRPVKRLRAEGRTKVVRERAGEVLGDERLKGDQDMGGGDEEGKDGEEDEFAGFEE